MKQKPEKRGYTIAETMHVIGSGRTKVYHLVAAGILDARAAGGQTIITAASIRSYMEGLPKAPIRVKEPSTAPAPAFGPEVSSPPGAEAEGCKIRKLRANRRGTNKSCSGGDGSEGSDR